MKPDIYTEKYHFSRKYDIFSLLNFLFCFLNIPMSYLPMLHFVMKPSHDVKNYWHRQLLFVMVQIMITLTLKEKDNFLFLVGKQFC